ncbi:hypothetical protein LAZ67_15000129 [Cordylochernes scorpioides]|uniref:Transporter n=1 Tax=Cordylochernes scorpioides TaxID=51811 RepID=A0ABY6L7S5_9ARAC|nr:hypothetical protein LAZ67_15000129 [Cordylochernes scorpioides]
MCREEMTEDTKTVDHQNGKLAVEQLPSASIYSCNPGVQVGRDKRSPSVVSRGGWGNRWEFLLSCVGLSVGIGNVWRFPYLAYANGGGAFLIPYLIMLLLAGKPLYFLEMAFGQFAGVGPVGVWSCLPIAKGVGWAMVLVCLVVVIYYCVIMAYTIFYIASTFQAVVPWSYCDPSWAANTLCLNRSDLVGHFTLLLYWCSLCLNRSDLVGHFTLLLYWCSLCLNRSDLPLTSSVQVNATLRNATKGAISASQAYWDHYVLEKTSSIADPGGLKWDLCLCLLLSWIIVIVCLIKGIKTSGKVVYFAATFPYIILVILLVTGLLQPGAFNGVMYFIKPDWDKLLKIEVWQKAAGQMFFSLSISMGALIMYSSYNGFRHNIFRDAMVVSVLDTLTSIVAGLVIFSILGAMAYESDQDISTVVNSGPGLAFVAYPEALTRLPCPQLWSFFFFFMLFVLGLDSEFALLENVISSVLDEFPKLRKHRTWFCLGLASCCYLIGLSCMSRGGHYVFEMMDNYGGNASLFFVAVMEIISIAWIYGQ